jgi:hypothetical protein
MIDKNPQNEFSLTTNDIIDVSLKLLNKIIDSIPETINKLKNENENSDQYLVFISDNLELFVQLVIELHHSLDLPTKEKLASTSDIKQLKIHLLSVIKAIFLARQKDDKIMLCDLIEYELKDNLTQWKINIIPKAKKSVNR